MRVVVSPSGTESFESADILYETDLSVHSADSTGFRQLHRSTRTAIPAAVRSTNPLALDVPTLRVDYSLDTVRSGG